LSLKSKARVRSETTDPQTSGHASTGASFRGTRRNELISNCSSPLPA
jgi:hypothetical protein